MSTELTPEERELICHSLMMRVNFIETHNPTMSAKDCIDSGQKERVKLLEHAQFDLIQQLKDLVTKLTY